MGELRLTLKRQTFVDNGALVMQDGVEALIGAVPLFILTTHKGDGFSKLA